MRPSSPSPGSASPPPSRRSCSCATRPPVLGRRSESAPRCRRRATCASGAWARAARCSSAPRPRCSASSCSSCTTRATSARRPRRPRSASCRSSARSCASSPAGARTARGCASRPMRRIAARNAALLAAVGALATGPGVLLYPLLAVAAISTMSWNGLAFTAAAEISGRARAGHGDEPAEHARSRSVACWRPPPSACSSRRRRGPPPTSSSRSRRSRPSRCCAPLEGDEDDRIAAARASRARDPRTAPRGGDMTTDVTEVQSGLEGVVAFATEIAEPDREGGALRYRGVDIEELVGSRALREGLGAARRRRASSPGCRPRSRTRSRALGRPARRRAVARWRRSPRSGASASSSTSATSRRARTSRARRSWR